ncbi:hypothetical protein ACHWQZ_G011303 [Mnemiopsis leidyi]
MNVLFVWVKITMVLCISLSTVQSTKRARTGEMRDNTVDLEEGFALMRAYLCTGSADWLEVNDSDRSDVKPVKWKNLGKCLGREIRNVVPLLLCQDKQSRESIAIIRTSVVKPLCLDVDKFFCSIAMWITEPSQVDSMVAYMGETTFCKKQHKVDVINLDAIQQKRGKRQYDLMTLYDVYTTVFCSKSQNTMYYDGHDDDSYEEMTPEMRRIVVLLSLRGPVCCFALTDGSHQ